MYCYFSENPGFYNDRLKFNILYYNCLYDLLLYIRENQNTPNMKAVYLLPFALFLSVSCSTQKFVKFEAPASETFSTSKLKEFLRSNPNPKVVLRVPNSKVNATEEDQNAYIYNTIEKELIRNNFIVRDRALFNEILKNSGDKIDYSEVKKKTDTEIILELSDARRDVAYRTNEYYTSKGRKSLFSKGDITAIGAKVDFKIILIENNEYAGSYNYTYTPCLTGCPVSEGKKGPKYSRNKEKEAYHVISKMELEDFFKNATNKMVVALRQ